ncbi:CBO0543 family protein [Neobacillus sp. GCM10023253]|uniref:CBO0543 family protein n=1 Tax=Neobacillus sp. GCM10023253 TaxID=3252644 RepID=UPI0036149187
MNFDYFILAMIWIVSIITLLIVVPRPRIREFMAVFFFFQSLTWIFGIVLTAFGILSTEVRLFEHATKISFTSEFMFYPTMAVVFHRWYPDQGGKLRVVLYYVLFTGAIILYIYLLAAFTRIMRVDAQQLIRFFFNFVFEFWACRRYVVWLMGTTKLQAHHGVGGTEEWK